MGFMYIRKIFVNNVNLLLEEYDTIDTEKYHIWKSDISLSKRFGDEYEK